MNQQAGGQGRKKEKRLRKKKEGLRELQDYMIRNNICIIGIPEGEEKEQGIENLLEKVMMENFLNLMRGKVIQIQETQRIPIKRNLKRPTSRHIIIKMAKFKKTREDLKGSKGETGSNIQGNPNKASS